MTDITTPFPATSHKLGLYPVVDSVEWIARLLDAGVTTIQLRIKDLPDEQVEEDIAAAIALGKGTTPGCLLMTIGNWRLNTMPMAYTWARKTWRPPIWRPSTAPDCV